MKKVFIKDSATIEKMEQVRIFDLNNETFTTYFKVKDGFKFGAGVTETAEEMGYNSIDDMMKSLKKRDMLGYEVTYQELKDMEKIGYIKLGCERIKRAGRVCTTDFEDVIHKLKPYGMGFVDAQNAIIDTYVNEY